MKASYKKKEHRFVITMLIVSSICCLLTNAAYNSGVSGFAASALGVVITPVQKLASAVHKSFSDFTMYFGDVNELKKENAELKEELAALEARLKA